MEKTFKLGVMVFLCLACLVLGPAADAATPPALVNYQGVLRSASGAPLTGSYDMVFQFYSASSGGTLFLTDTHNASAPSGQVVVSNGLFAAQLGAGKIGAGSEPNLAEMFRDNAAVYLEIQVGTETLSPRVRVTASAYAQNAKSLDGNDASAFATAGHTQTAAAGGTGLNTSSTPAGSLLTTSGTGTWTTLPAGTNGKILQSTGSAVQWVTPSPASDGDWTISGNDLFPAVSGNVGIGTVTPGRKLDVVDRFRARQGASGTAGMFLYQSTPDADVGFVGMYDDNHVGFWGTGSDWGLVMNRNVGHVGIGNKTPGFPLNFGSALGDKISLWGNTGAHYGFGVQSGLLQIHTDGSASDVALGYGRSGSFTETMRVKGNGNVGIGNPNPLYRLDVSGDARVSGALRDSSGVAGTDGQILKSTGTGTSWVSPASLEGDAVVGNEVTNVTDTTLARSGSGTGASPYTLGLNLGNANTWTGSQTFSAATNFPSSGIWNASGNVGIGTASPGFPLNFASTAGDKISLSGESGAHYGFGIQHGPGPGGTLQIHTPTSGTDVAFGFGSSGSFTERVRIRGTGSVGIGDSWPFFPLSFSNAVGDKISLNGSSEMHYGFGIQSGLLQIHTDGSGSDVAFGYGRSGAFTETMRVKGNGNLGIGTSTPQNKLDVEGGAAIGAGYGGTTAAPANGMIVEGSVGVGTSSPVGTLHVVGPLNVDTYGTETYDVQQLSGNFNSYGMWQSFTQVATGHLTRVDIFGRSPLASGADVLCTLKIYLGKGTGGTLLSTDTVLVGGAGPSWQSLPISHPPALTAGTVYTFGITASTEDRIWQTFQSTNEYPGGECSYNAAMDVAFKTTIATGSPSRVLSVGTPGRVGLGTATPAYQLQLSTDSAAKPATNTWTVASDARLKKDVAPFNDGLEVIAKINPVTYRYNGLADMPADLPAIGVVAQEIQEAAPYTVGTFRAKLNREDQRETDLLGFNSHALAFVMINAIKELDARTQGLGSSGDTADKTAATNAAKALSDARRASATGAPDDVLARRVTGDGGAALSPPTLPPGAERFPVCESVEVGDVLVAEPSIPGTFCLGRTGSDPRVVGIAVEDSDASPSPSVRAEGGASLAEIPAVTSGTAYCKVDAAYGPVQVGDLLATSPTPGHAMKAQPAMVNGVAIYASGTLIGKALEPLPSGTGLIKVLVMLR